MTDNELLQAISDMIDQKLEPVYKRLNNIENNMATKGDLVKSENMILSELDIIQEKTNQKFQNLKFKVM